MADVMLRPDMPDVYQATVTSIGDFVSGLLDLVAESDVS
jgi:hypothetical protein